MINGSRFIFKFIDMADHLAYTFRISNLSKECRRLSEISRWKKYGNMKLIHFSNDNIYMSLPYVVKKQYKGLNRISKNYRGEFD